MKRIKQAVLSITIFTFGFTAVGNSSVRAESPVAQDSTVTDSLAFARFFEAIESSMVSGLKSGNKDLVDSNLHHLVIFKTDYPEFQSDEITQILERIVNEEASRHLRYKAQLTLTYFQNQEQFNNLSRLKSLISQNEFIKIYFHLDHEVRTNNITELSTSVTL